jgi:hypothetical protein
MRYRHVLTAVGKVEFLRPWYLCTHCHNGQFPADTALDIDKTDLSPGVRRMLALVGSETSFDQGRQHLPIIVGEPIPILYLQMDGTGAPVVKKETEGRAGKVEARNRGWNRAEEEVVIGDGAECVWNSRHRLASETVRHVLDLQRRKRHHRPPLLPSQ